MTNLEKLSLTQNRADLVLVAYVRAKGVESLVNAQNWGARLARGKALEPCITQKQADFGGVHQVSQGDGLVNGESVEVKYLTKKTACHLALQGTTCKYTLVAFNDNYKIDIRKIESAELEKHKFYDKTSKSYKIKYQDTCKLGVSVETFNA